MYNCVMSEHVQFTCRRIQLTDEQMRQTNGVCLLAREALNLTGYDPADLPGSIFVEPSSGANLSTQIAEPGGLHTCDMTASVNAFIWQGWLTGEQGAEIHRRFPDFQPDRQFAEREINGKKVLIASSEEHVIEAVSGEKLYAGVLSLQGLSEAIARVRILGALSRGIVLNVADGGHSRLAVGYKGDHEDPQLWVSNPYHPNILELEPIDKVVAFHPSNAVFGVAKKIESMAYRPDIAF